MARVNIEDSLFKTKRWTDLVILFGDRDKALGALSWAWMTAQEYWFPDRKRIPRDVWNKEGLSDIIITAGLAEENEEGIKLSGSEEAFAWLFERQEAGKIGGKVSAKRPRDKMGRLLPNQIKSIAASDQTPPSAAWVAGVDYGPAPKQIQSSSSFSSSLRNNGVEETTNSSQFTEQPVSYKMSSTLLFDTKARYPEETKLVEKALLQLYGATSLSPQRKKMAIEIFIRSEKKVDSVIDMLEEIMENPKANIKENARARGWIDIALKQSFGLGDPEL